MSAVAYNRVTMWLGLSESFAALLRNITNAVAEIKIDAESIISETITKDAQTTQEMIRSALDPLWWGLDVAMKFQTDEPLGNFLFGAESTLPGVDVYSMSSIEREVKDGIKGLLSKEDMQMRLRN